jgi:glutaminase
VTAVVGYDRMPPAIGAQILSPIRAYLDRLHTRYSAVHDGDVATYIPELAKADADWFGISVATTDGYVYEVGDARQLFTIQSISKPFVYGLALEDRGREAVLKRIGVEPTGEAFNSISLAPETGCPLNPMINAGAIASTSLVAGNSSSDKLDRLLAMLSSYAGRPLMLDHAVYESERDTGHRNRAIGHLLRNFNIIGEDPEPALNLYFQQCSVAVDCRDLALMAATLANGGVHPLTHERAIRRDFVDSILSVMATCGMYDYAGEWLYRVGLPAKSGVAGGVLAVLPGQLGIGVFSPRLDRRGNSVRGIAVCKDLSSDFNLHFLRAPRSSRSIIRAQHSLADISSKRVRGERERGILDTAGRRARVYELQGDLVFAALETVVRTLMEASADLAFAIVDFKRVALADESAARVFLDLIIDLGRAGKRLVVANARAHQKFMRFIEEGLTAADEWGRLLTFSNLDAALEWGENQLLAERTSDGVYDRPVTLAEHQMCSGLGPDALALLETLMQRKSFQAGELIIRKGDPADGLYLLLSGQVSVNVSLASGERTRLSTIPAGMSFGELAVIDRSARTADVHADKAVECYFFSAAAFDELGERRPGVKMRILENLLRQVSRTVSRLNHELWALSH